MLDLNNLSPTVDPLRGYHHRSNDEILLNLLQMDACGSGGEKLKNLRNIF
jgi:hypothetical protein